ncbi:MAG: hypothetical protein J7647_06140 [Cyanobacteria bacterium SBLK]|nr:hypothetical protein [Cyanobacteria bacterium SBLK]
MDPHAFRSRSVIAAFSPTWVCDRRFWPYPIAVKISDRCEQFCQFVFAH